MNRSLKWLATVAISAFALAVLPAVASAGSFASDCEVGSSCTATGVGGATELEDSAGQKVSCESHHVTVGWSFGPTVLITFTNCRETASGFKLSCNSTGGAAGEIRTNTVSGDLVYIEPSKSTPGILLTNLNVTFNCAGFLKKTVTGSIIAHIENPNCGTFQASHTISFEKAAGAGNQKYRQVTTTGTIFDLIMNNDDGGSYLTSSLTGTAKLNVNGGNKVKLTC